MFQLIYVSAETSPFSADELVELLKKSRENNEKLGITGMLLYKGGNFLQVLEGEEDSVRKLSDRIAMDPRHKGVAVLLAVHSEKKEFPDWSMGFHNLNSSEPIEVEGYTRFLDSSLSAANFLTDPPQAKKLLLAFKSGVVSKPTLAKSASAK